MRIDGMRVYKRIWVDSPGLGARIYKARRNSEKKLTDLASAAGISAVHWTRIEKETQPIDVELLEKMEGALGVSFEVPLRNESNSEVVVIPRAVLESFIQEAEGQTSPRYAKAQQIAKQLQEYLTND